MNMSNTKPDKSQIESFLKQCRENVRYINAKKAPDGSIKTVFTIGCTKNYKNNLLPYTTPSRFNKYFCITGCVVFSREQAISAAAMLDGMVDIIAVDAEKKLPVVSGTIESGNLVSDCAGVIKKSKLVEFKANDLTVDAVWAFVSNKLNILSGRKIIIIGAGNIGSKLALKLVESGSKVVISRRDHRKGRIISYALNLVKPELTAAAVRYSDDILKSCIGADAILGCTDGYPAIEWKHIRSSKKDSLVIDVGKGSISKDAIKRAGVDKKPIYRTDISAALDAHLIMFLRNDEIIRTQLNGKSIRGLNFVSGGMYGRKGDIVVDNVNNPKVIFGIANGEGDFVRRLSKKQISLIKKLKDRYGNKRT